MVAATLAQLALFHVQSLSQIHWFCPVLMAVILSWFVIDRWFDVHPEQARVGELFRGYAPATVYALLAIFGALQMAPALFRGDSTLTGQGRVFALHMFEARQQCEITAFPSAVSQEQAAIDLKVRSLAPRMLCDPVIYFNRALNLCRTRGTPEEPFEFRLVMRAKRTTDAEFRTIIDEPKFCSAHHEYQLFRSNEWLR